MITLRPYQETMIEAVRAELRAKRNPVIVSPCGSGKGSLIAFMVHGATQRGHRVIFAVHGKSLVVDMSERVARLGIEHGVLMGGERRQHWHPVQVASIDTLHRMEHPPAAKLIIADECHLSLSPTWRKTLDRYPNAALIGATATPIRTDSKGLGKQTGGLFDSLVLGPSEEELIKMGHLVGSRVLAPPAPSDLEGVKKTAGEFNQKQLAQVCDKTRLIGDIVSHWKKHAEGRKTVSFGVDQAHAMHIKEQFSEAGVESVYIDAETSQKERQQIWRDYDCGSLKVISSVMTVSLGWDHPVCSCLIAARPTASLGLWRQMLGRGSRPYVGKTHFLVLDHSGNTHRHWPYGLFESQVEWSLDGAAIKDSVDKAPSITTCKKCYATFRAGPRTCPYCGSEIRIVPRTVEVEAGELTEITVAPIQFRPADKDMRAYHSDLMAKAQARGYKQGWIGITFKAKYHFWPPKRWATEWLSRELNKEMSQA